MDNIKNTRDKAFEIAEIVYENFIHAIQVEMVEKANELGYIDDSKALDENAYELINESVNEFGKLLNYLSVKVPFGENYPIGWPEELPSRHGDIIFKLIKVMSEKAKYNLIDAETGEEYELGGRIFENISQLKASANDFTKPIGGKQSTQF